MFPVKIYEEVACMHLQKIQTYFATTILRAHAERKGQRIEGYGKMKFEAVSGIVLTMLFIGILTLGFDIQPVKASATIYIRADGSVYPSTANITTSGNITYTFTDNNYDSIVIQRSKIVVNGAG